MSNYGNYRVNDPYARNPQSSALQELKAEIEKAIPDEQDAQRMYERMTKLARQAGLNEKAIEIDLIRGQEQNHERIFRDMLRDVSSTHQ
jgi:rubrerythrin